MSEEKTLFEQLEAIRRDVIQQVRRNGPALAAADTLIGAVQPVKAATDHYQRQLRELLEQIDRVTAKAAVAYEHHGSAADHVAYCLLDFHDASAQFAQALRELNDAVTAYAFSPARHYQPAAPVKTEEAA